MKKFAGLPLLAAVAFLSCFPTATPVFAQPTNIDCTNAIMLDLSTNYTFSTADAGSPSDPTNICSAPFGKGVWFSFHAPRNGVLTLSTCGSDFDTVIGIYTGQCGSLTFFSCADDNGPACPGAQASLSFPVTVDTTFYIVVGGKNGAGGNLQFTASISPPPNDQCTGAIALTNDMPYVMNTAGATGSNAPPICENNFGPYGVWFSYTPITTGPLAISTTGSDISTIIQIFTGACGNLKQVACAQGLPALQFQATNGITYLLYVTGFKNAMGAFGPLQIVAEEGTLPNDTCAGAIPLTNSIPSFADTVRATSTGDPIPLNGIWYSFTPESNGVATISTCGSSFPTALQVYTGSCDALSAMAGGFNAGYGPACPTNASVSFEATKGMTYYILAGGVGGGVGNMEIQAILSSSPNDHCQDAIPMQDGMIYTQNTLGSTTNGDPTPSCGSRLFNTVWYTYTPASNGVVTISTCGSDFSTGLQVYSGSCSALTPVPGGCSDGYGPACTSNRASVSFEGGGGVTYYVMVGGGGISSQAGNLQIQAMLSPSLNDHCQNAIPMEDGVVYTRNTVAATTNGDPRPSCGFVALNTVWYTYTPASSGVVVISTCGSDFGTGLQVYSGSCNALTPVPEGCAAGSGPGCSNRASVSFKGVGGATYYVMVGAAYSLAEAGNLQIRATLSPSFNDDCANAIAMQDGAVYTRNTAASTSTGDPAPSCDSSVGKGVWYTYTPAHDGVVIVSTCGSDFDTALQVYTGQCGALSAVANACNDGYGVACSTNQASLLFDGSAGTTYYIFVGGRYAATGNLQIQAMLPPALPNDRCAGAIALTNGVAYSENTETATSIGDPQVWYQGKGVWFAFTPSIDGAVNINTCGSDFQTALQVYTGTCGSLMAVLDDYNTGDGSVCQINPNGVTFLGNAGTTYLIFVGGWGFYGGYGNLQIQATVQPALPNDQCSGAIDISDGRSYTVDTTTATSAGDIASPCGGPVKGVWCRFTALSTNLITINVQATNFDTTLLVCSGTCGQLTNLYCGYNGSFDSSVSFTSVVDRTYFIQAGGIRGATGPLTIAVGALPPLNDQCSGAVPMIAGLKYTVNTAYATSTNDPVSTCDSTADHGVWYRYTPPTAAEVTIETCDSDFETVLQVYSGDCSSLAPVACNDGFGPACATNRASVSFFGQTGTNYYILAAGKNGAFGNLSISANGPPPANDTCDAAIDMAEGVVYSTNTSYASSTGDVFPVGKGVWYQFTPTHGGLLLVSSCGSDFRTAFNVYTGACNALTYYNGSASDSLGVCVSNRANAEFPVLPGVTYYIDAGGFFGASGNLSISVTMPPPVNDTCDGAIALTNGILYQMNNENATETGDPTPLCQTNFGKGVWFTFTPELSGTISISTCMGDLDSVLQVYTGGCGALIPVANSCDDDAGPDCNSFAASVHFTGQAGITYWILVGGYAGDGGNLAIEANILPWLTMQGAGTNSVLYWPTNLAGYQPQFTTNLTPPILWNSITGTPRPLNGNYFFTNSVPGGTIFYRLKK
jgi:hypothetical protein